MRVGGVILVLGLTWSAYRAASGIETAIYLSSAYLVSVISVAAAKLLERR